MTRGGASFAPGPIPLTLIAADFEREIAEVFDGLRQLVRKEICCFRKYLPMRIVDRGSVAEVNSAFEQRRSLHGREISCPDKLNIIQ